MAYVSDRRHIPAATIRDRIGAYVYDTKAALDLKLIDATGSRQDAYAELAEPATSAPPAPRPTMAIWAPSVGDRGAQVRSAVTTIKLKLARKI